MFLQAQLLRLLSPPVADYRGVREGVHAERPTSLVSFSCTFLILFAPVVQPNVRFLARALRLDLALLPGGEMTEVGEGITMGVLWSAPERD